MQYLMIVFLFQINYSSASPGSYNVSYLFNMFYNKWDNFTQNVHLVRYYIILYGLKFSFKNYFRSYIRQFTFSNAYFEFCHPHSNALVTLFLHVLC